MYEKYIRDGNEMEDGKNLLNMYISILSKDVLLIFHVKNHTAFLEYYMICMSFPCTQMVVYHETPLFDERVSSEH